MIHGMPLSTEDQYQILSEGGSQTCYRISDALQDVSVCNRLGSVNPLQISRKTNKLKVPRKIRAKTCNPMRLSFAEEKEMKEAVISIMTEEVEEQKMDVSVAVTFKETPRITSGRLNIKYVAIRDRVVPPRAVAVLPSALRLRRGDVFPSPRALPTRVRFGPAIGVCKKLHSKEVAQLVKMSAASQKPVFLLTHNDGSVTYIDMLDKDKSNWLSLLPLGDSNTANVWLEQGEEEQLYGVTSNTVDTRTALRLGYSRTYAEMYGMTDGVPVLDLHSELSQRPSELWCNDCSKTMPSLVELERHSEWHMKCENMKRRESQKEEGKRRHHLCRYCTRRFTKLSSLRRHLQVSCAKKKLKEQTPETNPTDPETPADETRLPSDESLQNYTNLLDISTSLFDTDRITLDISGSKSENDFAAFNMKDFALSELIDGLGSLEKKGAAGGRKKQNIVSSSPITCPYCKADMPRSKLKYHSRVCEARRFVCQCGVVCRTQQKLARHIVTRHPIKLDDETDDKLHEADIVPRKRKAFKIPVEKVASENEASDKLYECNTCGIVFKRRGMYVNHLSRTHGAAAAPATVPLVVRDKRYPCPACPKLYRAAAKRDRHVSQHHPGTHYRRLVIEGSSRTKEPAVCWACPKQYATRAKLLQHARAIHPNEMPPVEQVFVSKKTDNRNIVW